MSPSRPGPFRCHRTARLDHWKSAAGRGLRRLSPLLTALLIALAFSFSTWSSEGDELDLLRASLRRGAERLLELQGPEGAWPHRLEGSGELATSGRPARALLAAHAVLGEPRYLHAAERTARALRERLPRSARARSVGNLLFLAEHARASDDAGLLEEVRTAWHEELSRRGSHEAARAAEGLLARPNRTSWMDGGWRNYLLWHASETAALARALGEEEWADEFTLIVASRWAPKHDHAWWVMGAGGMLESLSRVPGADARRLASAELGLLRSNEIAPGLSWSETPYDTWIYSFESASALKGMLVCHDAEARHAARAGLRRLARLQAPHGGWGNALSLLGFDVHPGSPEFVAPAHLGAGETPELDAQVVLALAAGIGPDARVSDASTSAEDAQVPRS